MVDRTIDTTDEDLMVLYQNGTLSAFDELYKRYGPKVYGYLKMRVHSSSQVDEIFQTVFLKVHQNRLKFNSAMPFRPWLFTVCRNAMTDFYRKIARSTTTEVHLDSLEFENLPPPTTVAEPLAQNEPLQLVLAQLPKNQRKILELRYLAGHSIDEISELEKITSVNARQRISRALKNLKNRIALTLKNGPKENTDV